MTMRVDTEGLLHAAGRLEHVAASLFDESGALIGVNWWPIETVSHVSMIEVTTGAASAVTVGPGISAYAVQLTSVAAYLRGATGLYVAAEATIEVAMTSARAMATWLAGKVLAFLLVTPVGQALAVSFIAWQVAGISIAQGLATIFYGMIGRDAPNLTDELLDSVNWQELIRAGIDLGGQLPFGGLPPVLLPFIDTRGATGTAAIAYLVALQLGLLRPGVFTVSSRTERLVRTDGSPLTIGGLIDGIPPSVDGLPQVAVTTHTNSAGEHMYEIAITGTSSQDFGGGDQPLDNQGNAGTYAGFDAESVAAVMAAIEAAGVPAGATIVLTGYSQGAMVAQAIASSGKYNVEFVTTIGTPSRPDGIPDDTTVVEIEHPEDPIVGLQGSRPGHDDGAIVVTTDPVLDPVNPHHDGPMGNHSQDAYQTSAEALADSDDPAVQAAQEELTALFDGYEATGVEYFTIDRGDGEAVPGTVPWVVDGVTDTIEADGEEIQDAITGSGQGIGGAPGIGDEGTDELADAFSSTGQGITGHDGTTGPQDSSRQAPWRS